MKQRYLVTCMTSSEMAKQVYSELLKPLLPNQERLRLISYLDFSARGAFDREIRTWIHLSNGVIAILEKTAHNVFYEVGVAIGFGKPVVLLASNLKDVPSMLRGREIILFKPDNPHSEHVRRKLASVLTANLYGTFFDQRFQDHASILVNQSELAAPNGEDSMPAEAMPIDPDDLELGLYYYRSKNYDEAVSYLEQALEGGNQDADTYYYLADAYFLRGELARPGQKRRKAYQKMQYFAQEGTKFNPTDKLLRKTLGLSCLKLGELDRAEKIFNELLAEDPEYIHATYNLACLYALQRKKSHCLKFLCDVFRTNSGWRYLARLDEDFDNVWKDELIQRVMFSCPIE